MRVTYRVGRTSVNLQKLERCAFHSPHNTLD
ncbi:hypothetical protein fHeYen902_339c [Yersinia phage fHe-Yen9-02]|nr:hypothetical protein fHeYen902_339c [Yersinia phage fHe-Yen9-02]